MDTDEIIFHSIGTIRSPFNTLTDMPIQPNAARGIRGSVVLDPKLADGLLDLEGFSHLVLIYHFHRSKGYKSRLKPFLDDKDHGVFATRAPNRPNGIGLSIVKLLNIQGNVIEVENLDILNNTPLLDIKPYVPAFDGPESVRIGWLSNKLEKFKEKRSDDRFVD